MDVRIMCRCVPNATISKERIQKYLEIIERQGLSDKDFEYIEYPNGRLKRPLCPICRTFLNETQLYFLKEKGYLK
ncbi:MAG: hypothetical protein QW778_01855 [Candidatus Micrarchaeaceae archaeon]